jgi:hypothetical protein
MKQILLTLSLCCLFGAAANAQFLTVSGTVNSVNPCGPKAGQKVYLTDTIGTLFDSTTTSSTGAYSMNFPGGWSNPTYYQVRAYACGATWMANGKYVAANATLNLFICGTPKTLNGTIMLGSSPNTGPCKVWLIKVQRNYPTAGDTTLTAVDSVMLTNAPNYTFKLACVNDTFLVKAALQTGHTSYSNWLPSYDSSLTWSTATRYYASAFNGSPHYLFMFPGTNPGGAGFIGGSVLVGANKQAGVGDALPGRLLMLTNATTGAPVAYTYSDSYGAFSFHVPVGTYKLFGDAWGLYNIPLTVTLTGTATSVSNIIFEENYGENTFKGHFGTVGVGIVPALAGVSVYPNPATKTVSLTGLNNITGNKHVALRNIVGEVIMSQDFSNGQPVQIAVDALPGGTYILQLSTDAGAASFKVVK